MKRSMGVMGVNAAKSMCSESGRPFGRGPHCTSQAEGDLPFATVDATEEELVDMVKGHEHEIEFLEADLPIYLPEPEEIANIRPDTEPDWDSELVDDLEEKD